MITFLFLFLSFSLLVPMAQYNKLLQRWDRERGPLRLGSGIARNVGRNVGNVSSARFCVPHLMTMFARLHRHSHTKK